VDTKRIKAFKTSIRAYYKRAGRHDLPWRNIAAAADGTRDPYRILVSEVMLQQTQVSRVLKKYDEFLKEFPTVNALAKAPVAKVLRVWQGLGYNRRALLLKRAAEAVVRDFQGTFPRTAAELESLPGIGQSTRGALMAFAFSAPTAFIETNIRAVFLHFFFKGKKRVHDRDILPLIERTLDRVNPREWYYALMDYGVYLKLSLPNPSRRSAHHVRQSPFEGSNRQVRAEIVRFMLGKRHATLGEIERHIRGAVGDTPHDIRKNIDNLVREGFMRKNGKSCSV